MVRIVNLKDIEYTLAPFGKYPYGREFVGNMHYVDTSGCSLFKIKANKHHNAPCIVVISSGGCNLKVKATNAEQAGAQLLIVMLEESESEDITM